MKHPNVRFGRCAILATILMLLLACATNLEAAVPRYITDSASATYLGSSTTGIATVSGLLVATIGAQIDYNLWVTSDSEVTGLVQLWQNGPNVNMATSTWADTATPGVLFRALTANWTVPEGNQNAVSGPSLYFCISTSTPYITLPWPISARSTVLIDNMRPRINGPMTVTVNGIDWTGQWIKRGDLLLFSQVMDTQTFQTLPTKEQAFLDLSSMKGPASYSLSFANPHVSQSNFVASDGIDTQVASVGFFALDPYGNVASISPILTLKVDTIPPVIDTASISPARLTGTDSAHLSLGVASFDADVVTASCTLLSPTPIQLVRNGFGVYPATFIWDLQVPPSPTMPQFNGWTRVDFVVKDKALNTVATSVYFQLNNIMPSVQGRPVASITEFAGVITDGVGIVGDSISFTATASFLPQQNSHLYVDLSSINGSTTYELYPATGSSYFREFRIPAGFTEEYLQQTFQVTARDLTSGNTVGSWTTPIVYIDNLPPRFLSTTITPVDSTATRYKIGDQFRVSARVGNVVGSELGSVSVSVASLSADYSGSLVQLAQNSIDSTLFEGTFTVGSFSAPGTGWNGAQTIRVIASDSVGNVATDSVSSGLSIDNEFPTVNSCGFASRSATLIPPANGAIRAGDWLELRLSIATGHPDLNPIRIDLSPLGLAPRDMVASLPGTFTCTIASVPVGFLQNATGTFVISLSDKGGNAATCTVDVLFDTAIPVVSNVTVDSSGTPRGSRILSNDPVTITANVTNILPNTANHAVFIKLDRLGGLATDTPMDWMGGTTWRKTFNATDPISTAGVLPIDQTDWRFYITASNTSYQATGTSPLVSLVDTDPPRVASLTSIYVPVTVASTHPRIGDLVTLQVGINRPAKGMYDGESVTADMTSIGGLDNQPLTWDNVATFSYTFTVATGTLNNGATFPIVILDDAGNRVASQITFGLTSFDNRPPATGTLNVSVSLQTGKQDPTSATVINSNKYLVFLMPFTPLFPNDNGTGVIDLSLIGGLSNATMTRMATGAYYYVASAATITPDLEDPAYQFTVRVQDGSGNFASVNSTPFLVDCHPPQILVASATFVGYSPTTNATAPIGTNIDFTVQVLDNKGIAPWIDLSNLGATTTFTLNPHPTAPGWYVNSFPVPLGTLQGPASWPVFCRDDNWNAASAATNGLLVDQRPIPPVISNVSIAITRTNNDNPSPIVANINDQLTISANIKFWTTVSATETWAAFATDSAGVGSPSYFASGPLVLVGPNDLYAATFTVLQPVDWVRLVGTETISAKLQAKDIVNTPATLRVASAPFKIDNSPPVVQTGSAAWTVFPNVAVTSGSLILDNYWVINVGSGSPVDLLYASATIDTPLSSASIDFSSFPGGPATWPLAVTSAWARTLDKVSLAEFSASDLRLATFTMTLYDLAGNATTTAQGFYVDTRRPRLIGAGFTGATITVRFDENIASMQCGEWEICGSTTMGIATSTKLTGTVMKPLISNTTLAASVDLSLTIASQAIIAGWASQSLYLKVQAEANAPVTDLAGNWGYAQDAFPIEISDYRWREDPRITSFQVTQNWTVPQASVTIDFVFTKAMAPATLVASNAVLFVLSDDFSSVNYRNGYVFQPAALDKVEWPEKNHLRIVLNGASADWIGRKLANGDATIKFATRNNSAIFCYDELGKPMLPISIGTPLTNVVTRPYTYAPWGFAIENSVASQPQLTLGADSSHLLLNFSDRAVLYTNDFCASDSTLPRIGVESPTGGKGIMTFHNAIELHDVDVDPPVSIPLALENLDPLDTALGNNVTSSMSVRLKLSDTDLTNILALYRSHKTPNWRLKVNAGAFTNWWSQPNPQYFPMEPGSLKFATASVGLASLTACAISPMTPINDRAPNTLTFDFEFRPALLGNIPVPLSLNLPTARIVDASSGLWMASGTFQNWSARTIGTETRYVARFTNAAPFPSTFGDSNIPGASTPGRLEIFGVTDVFGKAPALSFTTLVYDLNARDDTRPNGYSSASSTFRIDMQRPWIASISVESTGGGRILRQSDIGQAAVIATFSELMMTSVTPTLALEMTTNGLSYSIPFQFTGWIGSTTYSSAARFVNDTAITQDLPQGSWSVNINASDLAGNLLDPATGTSNQLTVYTVGPQLVAWQVSSQQFTTASDPNQLFINTPFSGAFAPNAATLSFTLATTPVKPIWVEFTTSTGTISTYSPTALDVNNTGTFTWQVGSATTAALAALPYTVRLVDANNNGTVQSLTWTRDDTAPNVALTKISGGVIPGVGSPTWFNPTIHTAVTTLWNVTGEAQATRLRVRNAAGTVSTDTYLMTAAGTQWNGRFTGRRIDPNNPGNTLATDGLYFLDVVDVAGNVGATSSALPYLAKTLYPAQVWIDTVAPVVATITLKVNDVPANRFSPNAASLAIELTTSEPASTTIVEIRTDAVNGTLIASLSVTASGTGSPACLATWWDGTRSGKAATRGTYRVYTTDLAGNKRTGSTDYIRVFVTDAAFTMQSATQLSSNTVELRFDTDHQIDPNYKLRTASFTFSPAVLTTTSVVRTSNNTLLLTFNPPSPATSTTFDLTVLASGVRSIEGAWLSSTGATRNLAIDTIGARVTGVSFDGLTAANQRNQFYLTFDRTVTIDSGTNIALNTKLCTQAAVSDDATRLLVSAPTNLVDGVTYTVTVTKLLDDLKNPTAPGTASATFIGPDRTGPVFTIAAFSNPANARDLMIVASVSEALSQAPTLRVEPTNGPAQELTMTQQSAGVPSYMAGIHLDPSYAGNGYIYVSGTDAQGNVGSGTLPFSIAVPSPNIRMSVESPDHVFSGIFTPGTVNRETMVIVIPQTLSPTLAQGSRRFSLAPSWKAIGGTSDSARSTVRASRREMNRRDGANASDSAGVAANAAPAVPAASELVSTGKACDFIMIASHLARPFEIRARITESDRQTPGLGIFRYEENGVWTFVGNTSNASNAEFIVGTTAKPGIFALLRDVLAPRILMCGKTPEDDMYRTDRPVFDAAIDEQGSGLNFSSVVAVLDGIEQPVQTINPDGSFRFMSLNPLVNGDHELVFQAVDVAGNMGRSTAIRFQINVPLAIGEMMNYPNPVRTGTRATIRISANRDRLAWDLFEIKIYDTAGHRVRILNGVQSAKETALGGSTRYLYDIPWDLRNEDGVTVANGVYFARIELRDPDDATKTIKKTHKIAVLR
ncbi:MAG: hypothetical protein WA705_20220 [Candidatus Ozemobacteraceae bacterium]